jgi:hypothetical protein
MCAFPALGGVLLVGQCPMYALTRPYHICTVLCMMLCESSFLSPEKPKQKNIYFFNPDVRHLYPTVHMAEYT